MGELAFTFVNGAIMAGVAIGLVLTIVPGLIYLERKIAAYIQGRLGPNRVNLVLPLPGGGRIKLVPGSLQPVADAIKLAFKEEIVPKDADKLLWYLGPVLAFLPVGAAMALIPFGIPDWDLGFGDEYLFNMQTAPAPGAGLLVLLAISSLAVYGIATGGWGSGSKFPLMGAVRASAQMISYEVALGIALVSAIASAGTLDMQEMVQVQALASHPDVVNGVGLAGQEGFSLGRFLWAFGSWGLFKQPLAALIVFIAMFAENNRLPFDLPECEPELVGGFHTEYTGFKFALYFLAEYAAMILFCALFTTVFLGGWSFPGLVGWSEAGSGGDLVTALLSFHIFLAKMLFLLLIQLWTRWTLPRFRYDQLMDLGWKVMVPLALGNLVVTAIVLTFTS